MRKILHWTSLSVIIASVAFLGWLNLSEIVSGTGAEDVAFPTFAKDQAQWVEFDTSSESYQALSPREKTEQRRDWLLYAVATSSNRPAVDMEQALFDVVPVRTDTLAHLGQAQTGEARSCVMSSHKPTVLALIPKAAEEVQADLLADIADEQRKNAGSIPGQVHVFEYELTGDGEAARITYRGVWAGADLFGSSYGYIEQSLGSVSDLSGFLQATDDVVYAHLEGATLRVGGRRLKSHRIKGVGVEEIASVWKSSQRDPDLLGFSLDPQIEKEKLQKAFEKIGVTIKPEAESEISIPLGPGFETNLPLRLYEKRRGGSDPDNYLRNYREALGKKYGSLFPKEELDEVFREIVMANRFQKARYDGDFKGTEVGMVLFYTDLLMKLWGQDQLESTPRVIPEFPNCLDLDLPSVHEQELHRLGETRLWLGPLEAALQKDAENTGLYLARTATRLFALPHDSIGNKDLKEAEPNAADRIFIGWWNTHYAEIARYEPQYERLNEIIKWSAVIGWLQAQGHGTALSFLEPVTVQRNYWFEDWAKSRPELTFSRWDELGFLKKGYEGSTTEALKIQYSRVFEDFGRGDWQISGGVSLGGKAKLQALKPLSEELSISARRGGMAAVKTERGTWSLFSHAGSSYETRPVNPIFAKSIITPGESVRLRGVAGELSPVRFERSLVRNTSGAAIRFQSGNEAVGELRIARSANGLKTAWEARDLDTAYTLAKSASKAADPDAALMACNDVEVVLKRANGEYLVQLRASDNWVRLAKEPGLSEKISPGFEIRASGGPTSPIYDAGLVGPGELNKQLGTVGYVEVRAAGPASDRMILTEVPRPPPDAQKIVIKSGGKTIEAQAKGEQFFIDWSSLPPEGRGDTTYLAAGLGSGGGTVRPVPMAKEFASRSYAKIADRIMEDPRLFRQALDEGVDAQLNQGAKLWRDGRATELQRQIAFSERLFGDLPEIKIQKALAQLEQGKPEAAARTLDSCAGQPAKRAGVFLNEIEARMADPGLGKASRANLQTVHDYAVWSTQTKPGIKLGAHAEGGRLSLRYETSEISKVKYPANEKIAFQDVTIYVEDSPGLNTADWSPGSAPSHLQDWVQSERVEVHAIQDIELVVFKPSMLVETKTGTKFHLAESGARTGMRTNIRPECRDEAEKDPQSRQRPCLALMVRQVSPPVQPSSL